MSERAEKQDKLAWVRQLYKRACRANYFAKQEEAIGNGLQDYFYLLKYHWLFRAVFESFPAWQEIFEVTVNYDRWLVCVRPKAKADDRGLHMPVRGVEKYMEFLRGHDEFMYVDLREVFREALYACESQRWEESWKASEREERRRAAPAQKRQRQIVYPPRPQTR